MKSRFVKPWMKKNVVSIHKDATVMDAAELLTERQVGSLPVIDDRGNMVGLTTMKDVVSFFLPDFLELFEDVDFLKDFGALRGVHEEDLERANSTKIHEMMREPISIGEDCSPIRALSIMETHSISDLPVIKEKTEEDILVGIVSRVDLGRAFLSRRLIQPQQKKTT